MDPSPLEDPCPTGSLLERWRAGDDAAFAVLWQRLAPILRMRVCSCDAWPLIDGQHEVDDVLQEVWARATTAVRTTFTARGPGATLAYLGTITDDTVVTLARAATAKKRGYGRVQELETNCERPDADRGRGGNLAGSTVDTPTSCARVAEIVEMARVTLSEREFQAWDFLVLRDFSDEEAGLALRCSAAAVRGLVHRAKARLVARLGNKPLD